MSLSLKQISALFAKDRKKHTVKGWFYHVIMSVTVVALIKWLTFDVYIIPTPSMEGSLLVGDFLLVSKLSYGARTPRTPLQIPLTNGVIWGTSIPSYLDWIKWPMYRLPGIGKVERGEMVVFHYPNEPKIPSDVRTFYVKRCVALPGDIISVQASSVFINGSPASEPNGKQQRYFVRSSRRINRRTFRELHIWEVINTPDGYVFHSSEVQAQKLAKKPFVSELRPLIAPADYRDTHLFPSSPYFVHNVDHLSPIRVPHKGMKIALNDTSLALYGGTILAYEALLLPHTIQRDTLYIDDQPQESYTFSQDYYFMMGDNRHNSQDSRYWGFVPEDHVVGKPKLCLISFDQGASLWNFIRWDRIFKVLE